MKEPKFKFDQGMELKDVITDFKGIVMVRCDYATGCRHYGLQAPMDKDGKVPDWQYIDESRLIPTGRKLNEIKKSSEESSGPCSNPPQW